MKFISKLLPLIIIFISSMFFVVSAVNVLTIDKNTPEVQKTFEVKDIVPGKVKIENYSIAINYKGTLNTYFTINIKEGYEEFSDVLKCKISVPDEKLLYDGYISEVPELVRTVESSKNTSENLDYSVLVYLEKSNSEYSVNGLIADFVWWADVENENGELIDLSEVNNVSKPLIWCFLFIILGLIGFLYYLAGW